LIGVILQGRMGNQMFQMAFAHLISKRSGSKYLLLVNKNRWYLNAFRLPFPYSFYRSYYFLRFFNFIFSRIKFHQRVEVLSGLDRCSWPDYPEKKIYNGYFQTASLYEPYLQELREIFVFKKKVIEYYHKHYRHFFEGKKVMVVSMRLGVDYKNFQLADIGGASVFLPVSWYLENIKRFQSGHDLILVLSDEPEEAKEILIDFKNIHFINDIPEIQFQILQHADTCIIGNSSFSWWGAFLNSKPSKRVIAPYCWAGFNVGIEYPAGIMVKGWDWI